VEAPRGGAGLSATARSGRLGTQLRETDKVTPLELFFDLVFVLALTQVTALMAEDPTWAGLAKGMVILGILWWSWVGYAWLTSVIDPEEGVVRLIFLVAMAALLVIALCVPDAFGDRGLLFAVCYGIVRFAHIALFVVASRDDPDLRKSVKSLAVGTAIGVGLVVIGALLEPTAQGIVWGASLLADMAVPAFFGAAGWKLMPEHFAERHGLIIIIALGESIVAIGVGAEHGELDGPVVAAAVLGISLSFALWWLYFDVVALVAQRRLLDARPGRERNEIARDSFTFLHLPMVAGIVLGALGLKKAIEDPQEALKLIPAVALLGGTAIYLLAHVAFRWRTVHRFSWQRMIAAVALAVLIALATEVDALVTLLVATAVLAAVIAYEAARFAELRDRLRHQHAS
jgi:low temperature requirement protein LtrA